MPYDIGTDVGKIRFTIGDTDTTNEVFSDAEIEYALTLKGSVPSASVYLLRRVLAQRALFVKRLKLGLYESEDYMIRDILAIISEIEGETAEGATKFLTIATSDEHLDGYRPVWVSVDE